MICQEVMELMQRNLDQDLSDQEMKDMHEHISQCPHCSAMYDRLNQLNAELISLPKVAPAYSIVDRILPELDHIDQGSTSDSSDDSHSRSRLRWYQTGAFKAVTGTVAAGILIFLFAFGGVFNTMNTTQHADDSANNAGTFSSSADSTASDSMGKATANVTTSSNRDNDQALDKEIADVVPSELDQSSSNAFTSKSQARELHDNSSPEVAHEEQLAGALPPEAPMMRASNDNSMMMNSQPEPIVSPNGEYIAVLLTADTSIQVVIYSAADGEELHTTPAFKTEEIMNVRWSDDSQYVEFDVALQNSVTSHKLHVQ